MPAVIFINYIMFRIFASKNPVFRFSSKQFDLAIIGAGPGGTSLFI